MKLKLNNLFYDTDNLIKIEKLKEKGAIEIKESKSKNKKRDKEDA